ncbi:MAG: AMP-binding protein [Micrococcus sp.]|nr:AMP-binding protein [Micrococcus sp.]
MSRLAPARGTDHAALLRQALADHDAGRVPLIGDERWSAEHWSAVVAAAHAKLAELDGMDHDDDAPAWAAFTSGSTGSPKVVLRSQCSWTRGFDVVDDWVRPRPDDVLLAPVHPVSSMTVFAVAWAQRAGVDWRVPAAGAVRASDLAGVTLVHATPHRVAEILDLLDAGPSDDGPLASGPSDAAPHRLRHLLVGGDRLTPGLRERAAAHGIALSHYYGAAELSLVAVDHDGTGLRLVDGVAARVCTAREVAEPLATNKTPATPKTPATAETLDPSEAAHALVSAPGVLELRTAQAALGLPIQPGGWVSAGDRATLMPDPDGASVRLELHGREDSAVLTAGATVIPAEVEAATLALRDDAGDPLVTGAFVCGRPAPRIGSLLCIYLEPGPAFRRRADDTHAAAHERTAALVRHLRDAWAEQLPTAARPRLVHVGDALARTASGKVVRDAATQDALTRRVTETCERSGRA